MVKRKMNKKFTKRTKAEKYQIKTRHREKKLCSMSREIKNLQESQWMPNTTASSIKAGSSFAKSGASTKIKNRISTRFTKTFKKAKNLRTIRKRKIKNIKVKKKNQNDNLNSNDHTNHVTFSKNSKKNKNNHKNENARKMPNELYKYIYQGTEYFELKEVLGFLYDDLNIDLDSPNNKMKDKEQFKSKMNEMLKEFFVIYYNKILINPKNLFMFLNYLSTFIKFDTKDIITLLYKKCKTRVIEENIALDHYFKPTLFLVEK